MHWKAVVAGHTCELKTFSVEDNSTADADTAAAVPAETDTVAEKTDLTAYDIGFINEDGKLGMHFAVKGCMECEARVHIPGRFSVYNSLVTMLVCHLAGISEEAILQGLSKVQVKGRVEMLPVSKDYSVTSTMRTMR